MRRLAWIAVGLAAVVAISLSAYRVLGSPSGRVIFHDPDAPWIAPVEPFSAMNRQWGRDQAPPVRFESSWTLAEVPDSAPLRLRAFGAFGVRVNDRLIPFDSAEDRRWQVYQVRDVATALRPGPNRIVVDVRNRRGPALLSLALDAGRRERLTSASGFSARIGTRPAEPADVARDVRRHPAQQWLATPWQGVRRHAVAIAAALLLGAVVLPWGVGRGIGAGLPLARITMAGAAILWLLLLWLRIAEMPLLAGFDARGHLEVVGHLMQGRIPLATDGWSTYHPPLYHLLVAGLAPVGDAIGSLAGMLARRLPAWLAGLGLVWLAGRLARVLHPDRPGLQAAAIAFAALVPFNIYIAGTISNEGLLAFLAAGAVVFGAELMRDPEVRPSRVAAVSAWLGLALLTKYTALVALAVVGPFVLLRILSAGERSPWRRGRDALWLVAPAALVAGWFYARNLAVYGRALVPNWDLPGPGRIWWSPPGFHTADYYLGFGRALSEPYYASFGSFWDGLYSTLFGDGLLSGAPGLPDILVPWNLEWMSVGFWAALPIAALIVVGALDWLREAVREPDPRRATALALPLVYTAAMLFAIFYATLSLPFFGQARASYGLSIAPVLALAFARGLSLVGVRRSKWARRGLPALLGAVCAVWALSVAGAFFG